MGTVRKKISAKKKIEVVAYAKKYSNRSAPRKFGIHRKCVRVWRRSENNLRSLNGKSARRVGGGRKPKFPYLEERLLQHFRQQREKKLRVSGNQLKRKAVGFFEEMVAADEASDGNFTASDGWVTNFMRRNRISLRRITTTCQNPQSITSRKSLTSSSKHAALSTKNLSQSRRFILVMKPQCGWML